MARRRNQVSRPSVTIFLVSLLVVLLFCTPSLASNPDQQPHQDDVLCSVREDGSSFCYPKVFQATDEFQAVLPGQQIHQGLHVRLNVETGEKEAKLYNPNDASPDQAAIPVVIESDHSAPASSDPAAPVNVHGKEDPYVKPKPRLTVQEKQAFSTIVESLHNSTVEEIIETLEFLEEVVHHVDFGQQFVNTPDAIPTFIGLLSHANETVQSEALLVLGNALSNNPPVQKALLDAYLLPVLLTTLNQHNLSPTTTSTPLLTRTLFTLGALIRSNPAALTQFHQMHGLTVLHTLYKSLDTSSTPAGTIADLQNWMKLEKVKARIISLASDILNPQMESESDEVIKPQMNTTLEWCTPFQLAYLDPNLDLSSRRDALRGLMSLVALYGEEEGCRPGFGMEMLTRNPTREVHEENFSVKRIRKVLEELEEVVARE
ncbi:hypothetical protein HK097_002313 [Rhizophlyctis rosea]|uniref:Nucleotide exchange factor SIL1 n=1 Tax=Rhizophlyctis rosea TaxID=64517 RepID=A0AAD5SJN8_9FUNG|nr:hypothetical protein HK097_002313 [Rhizophlyctis rosea]